jgi:photosystem II stability/assembly factor-like uncharacterized protein
MSLPVTPMKVLAALLFVVLNSTTVLGQWTQTSGPTGAHADEVISLGDYLFLDGDAGGVFRSADKGATWQLLENGLPPAYQCMEIDVENTNVYVVTTLGVYYSSDFGDSWNSISDTSVFGFSLHVSGNEIFVGYHNGLLHYSPDHGATWQTITTRLQITISMICKFGNSIWVGSDSPDLFYSPNGGANWIKAPLHILVTGIDVIDNTLFVSGNDWNSPNAPFKVYRCNDQGFSWTQILATPENNRSKTGFVKRDNEIFVSGSTNYYYSPNNGVSWTTRPFPPLFTFYPWSSVAVVDNDLIVAYGDGVVFSSDNGTTWESRNVGFRNHTIENIVETNNAIISLSYTNGAFASTTNGDQWKQIHDPSLGFPLPYNIYAYGDAVVMDYSYTIYKSLDNGDTWQPILTPDVSGLNIINAAHIAGFEESIVATCFKGVYLSRNMGDTWSFVPTSTFGQYELLKSYIQHDTVVVLTQEEMYMSTNFGATWQKKTVPELPVRTLSILDIDIEGSMITLATGIGLYKSPDFGSTWKKMQEFNFETVYAIEKSGERTILGTFSGVYVSGPNGIGWYAVNDGLNGYHVKTLLVSEPYSYIGTAGQSVWRIPTSELLTPRELIDTGPGVRIPLVTADCSTLTITNAAADVVIRWYKNGSLIPNQSTNLLQATGPGRYAASFENDSDIKISAPIFIGETNKESIIVYDVITANGDGKNETYVLDEQLTGSKLMIINRWGETVYSNDSYQNNWSADQISSGEYFYYIESKCYGTFKGPLTVIR